MKKKIEYIFSSHDKKMIIVLMILTVVGSVLELLGVTIFLPFVNIIMYPDYVKNNEILNWFYEKGGFSTVKGFEVFLCIVIIGIYITKNVYLIVQKNITYKFSFHLQKTLATKLLNSYMKEPYSFHLRKNVAQLQRALQEDVANFSVLSCRHWNLLLNLVCVFCWEYIC